MDLPEGTAIFQVDFPDAWPPQTPITLFIGTTNRGTLELLVDTRGALAVQLHSDKKSALLFSSAPLKFWGGHFGIIVFYWSNARITVKIEEVEVPSVLTSQEVRTIELRERLLGDGSSSFSSLKAVSACLCWMRWREEKLGSLGVPDGRIAKSLTDQVRELQFAMQRIIELVERLKQGDMYWLGSLAVELRSLLSWKDSDYASGKKRRNIQVPLLLKVARYRNLPLAVYVKQGYDNREPLVCSDMLLRSLGNDFSTVHEYASQRLTDIQDWLSSVAFMEGNTIFEVREVIAWYTETLGPGHYDSGLPSVLDTAHRLGLGEQNRDVISNYLIGIAEGVTEVGEYVLSNFSSELI